MPFVSLPSGPYNGAPGHAWSDLQSLVNGPSGLGGPNCDNNWVGDGREWHWVMPVYYPIGTDGSGGGKNALYSIINFVGVDVYCTNFTGNPKDQNIQLRFKRVVTTGDAGGGGGAGIGVSFTEICDVDNRGTC